jgi:hypothetical protein
MIPLIGLPHYVDVIRYAAIPDGMGGVKKGPEITIYSDRNCRMSTWDGEEVVPKQHGFEGPQEYKIVMEYSPLIQDSDFLKVPYGTVPNVGGGAGDGFTPKVDIETPDGTKTLTWRLMNSDHTVYMRYSDDDENYVVAWNGDVWVFQDNVNDLEVEFTGYVQENNIFNLDWPSLVGAAYSVTEQYGDPLYLRILEKDHKFDHVGNMHHTTLRIEEEESDA